MNLPRCFISRGSALITSFEAADNDVWYDPEPANQASKFYQVLSLP
jgi:hypothetical protein